MDSVIASSSSGMDSSAPGWVNGLMETLGAPGAGIAIALENLFPPIPSEVILPMAGFAASTGSMNLVAALVWTTVGSVVGALALYGVGALLGRERTVAIAAKLPLVKVSDIEKTEAWFAKHGAKAVFFGRMLPIFRSMISVPAGVERMRLPLFLTLTTLGSAIWNTVFVLAGYVLGENWDQVAGYVSAYSKVVLAAAALAVVAFLVVRLLKPGGGSRRADRASGRTPEAREPEVRTPKVRTPEVREPVRVRTRGHEDTHAGYDGHIDADAAPAGPGRRR